MSWIACSSSRRARRWTVGQPHVEGAKVVAEVARQGKADKVIVFKYKSKVRYHVKNGHRQQVTRLSIKQIVAG